MKLVIASSAILCLLIASSCYGQSHNVFWGTPAWNDTRIFYQHVNVTSSFLQVITRDVVFPSAVSFKKKIYFNFVSVNRNSYFDFIAPFSWDEIKNPFFFH